MESFPSGSIIGDIGCGNGKNMNSKEDCSFYGCDFSEKLVEICQNKELNVIPGDILNIPYRDQLFDFTLSIAVIHHLSTTEKRRKAIQELLRVTKVNGKVFILVWALEQEKDSRRKFTNQINYVDWKDKKGNLLGKRYYYVFKKDELESLIPNNCKIVQNFYEKGNWGIILQKLF
tara:strand:+ start:289 stop:813 length:525 start_codon:yes stop_codon:yes gene_type:complete